MTAVLPNRTRRSYWRRRLFVIVIIGLFATGAGLYFERHRVLPQIARYLDVSAPPEPVDYVMVLGGGNETRPFVAAALVRARFATGVLVSTAQASPEALAGLVPTEQEIIRRVLLARKVPAEAIQILPGECTSTNDEAHVLAEFMRREPNCRVAIVTTNLHSRRASWIFRKILGSRASQVRFVAPATGGFSADNWWQCEHGFRACMNEYLKLGFYFARY